MADYGYSSAYRGMTGGTLPAGYMEAATAPGRAYGAALSNIGQNIAGAIRGYIKNKEEEQYLTSKIEAGLAQYADIGRQGPLPSGATADLENLGKIVGDKNLEKFMSGKATRMDKLAIANSLETYADKESRILNNQLAAQNIALNQAKFDEIQRAKAREEALIRATGKASEVPLYETKVLPQTTTQNVPDYQALQQMFAEALAPRVSPTAPTTPITAQWFKQAPEVQVPEAQYPAAGKPIIPGDGTQLVPTPTTAKYFQGIQPSLIKAEPKIGPAPTQEMAQPETTPTAGRQPLPSQVPTKEVTVQGAPEVFQRARTYEEMVPEFTKILKENKLPVTQENILSLAAARGVQPQQIKATELPGGAMAVIGPKGQMEVIQAPKVKEGQPLAVEEIKQLKSIKSVASDLAGIRKSLEGTMTGPVIGRLRELNTFDKVRKELESRIQAALPEVARGLFGEVGVLTDKDVERYMKILPSIRDSKELSDMLLKNLEDKLARSYQDSLSVYSQAGKNISGFPRDYREFVTGTPAPQTQSGIQIKTYNPVTGKIE